MTARCCSVVVAAPARWPGARTTWTAKVRTRTRSRDDVRRTVATTANPPETPAEDDLSGWDVRTVRPAAGRRPHPRSRSSAVLGSPTPVQRVVAPGRRTGLGAPVGWPRRRRRGLPVILGGTDR